jgi:serine/threonine-protein kinase
MGGTSATELNVLSKVVAERYQPLETIGAGGMGVVYRAFDTRLKRDVALKVIKPELLQDEVVHARFRREALALAGLSHPNIVAVYDLVDDADSGATCIVMELLQGQSLRDGWLSNSAPSPVEIASQMAAALEAAHTRSILHRDIKPDNIFVCLNGTLKLMDFGLARVTNTITLTETDSVGGTLAYMSPEQLTNGSLDARTDLYSLGVVLYEAVAGYLPFAGDNPAAIILKRLNSAPEPIAHVQHPVPSGFQEMIISLLQPDPTLRIASAAQLHECVAAIKSGTLSGNMESYTAHEPYETADQPKPGRKLLKNAMVPAALLVVVTAAVYATGRLTPADATKSAVVTATAMGYSQGNNPRPALETKTVGTPNLSHSKQSTPAALNSVPVAVRANASQQTNASVMNQLSRQNRQIDALEKMLATMQKQAKSQAATKSVAKVTQEAPSPAPLPVVQTSTAVPPVVTPHLRASAFKLHSQTPAFMLLAFAPPTTQFAVYQPSRATHSLVRIRWMPQMHELGNGLGRFQGRLNLSPGDHPAFLLVSGVYDGSGTPPQSLYLPTFHKHNAGDGKKHRQSPAIRFQQFKRELANRFGANNVEIRMIPLKNIKYINARSRQQTSTSSNGYNERVPLQP